MTDETNVAQCPKCGTWHYCWALKLCQGRVVCVLCVEEEP